MALGLYTTIKCHPGAIAGGLRTYTIRQRRGAHVEVLTILATSGVEALRVFRAAHSAAPITDTLKELA